jgi:hypothetical protein
VAVPIHDVICHACGAKQVVASAGLPFRYVCGNPTCGTLSTWRGARQAQAFAGPVQYFPARPRRLDRRGPHEPGRYGVDREGR